MRPWSIRWIGNRRFPSTRNSLQPCASCSKSVWQTSVHASNLNISSRSNSCISLASVEFIRVLGWLLFFSVVFISDTAVFEENMTDPSSEDNGLEELAGVLENEENYCRMLALQRNQVAGTAIKPSSLSLGWSRFYLTGADSDSASSTTTTPGPLDTAFLHVSPICLLRNSHRCDLLFRHRKPAPMINTLKLVYLWHKVHLLPFYQVEHFTLGFCVLR